MRKDEKRPNGFIRITPSGMRAVADAYEAGMIDQFMGEAVRKITAAKS
jgi:hypothetical protein